MCSQRSNKTIPPKIMLARAKLVSLYRRRPLPPGTMKPGLDEIETANRLALLENSRKEMPIFKGWAWDSFWIYVIGLPRCRRIIRDHEADMRPVTIDTTSIFAEGLLRQMEGEVHRKYRTQLVQALNEVDFTTGFDAFGQETERGLRALAAEFGTGAIPYRDLYDCLSGLVFNAFVRMIFGIDPDNPRAEALHRAYQQLGGNGLVWAPGSRQKQAVENIADILRSALAGVEQNSLLGQLHTQGPVDGIMLGNLIYMVEMGRYDTTAFLRWLMWFAAGHRDWADRIANDQDRDRIAGAFVSEALRLEQAERLVRRVKRDFVAEGFLFPKGAMVRFCIWESHKLPDAHERPFEFDPGRFLGQRPGPDRYSPFGADRHQCPFGTFSIRFGSAFLRAAIQSCRLSAEGTSGSVRGLYHWEPEKSFRLILGPREAEADA